MEFSTILLVIIFHRIGFILISIATGVIVMLPHIFQYDEDREFAERTMKILLKVSKLGLYLLVTSGLIRLSYNIPTYITIKLFFATIIIYLYFLYSIPYDDKNYLRKNILRLLIIAITATIGYLI